MHPLGVYPPGRLLQDWTLLECTLQKRILQDRTLLEGTLLEAPLLEGTLQAKTQPWSWAAPPSLAKRRSLKSCFDVILILI